MNRLRSIDVHQHLLTEPVLETLKARRTPPRLRGWALELAGEPDYLVRPLDHDFEARAKQAEADGLTLAVVSLSSALGIESLPYEEANELIAAYHHGCATLPHPFRAWAATALANPDPTQLTEALDRGCVGLQLPAAAVGDAGGYERLAPLLHALEDTGKPLFIHPGPVSLRDGPAQASTPAWWPALVPYVQQMHAAWFAFRAHGRPRHPRLRVCFAMLSGLAPLHVERFAARAGLRTPVDPQVFLDVSSYGTQAIDATVRVLGIDALVNGSDRPYAEPVAPGLGDAARHAIRCTNPTRLLEPTEEVSHEPALAAGARSESD